MAQSFNNMRRSKIVEKIPNISTQSARNRCFESSYFEGGEHSHLGSSIHAEGGPEDEIAEDSHT